MRVLLACPDRVAPTMAGTGIRYAELARRLAARHEVTLMGPVGSENLPDLKVGTYDLSGVALRRACKEVDVLLAPPLPPGLLARVRVPWTVDLYNPEPFEGLALQRGWSRGRRRVLDTVRIDRLSFAIRSGTTFVCATERQRDMWLGYLAAQRRLDSDIYARDPMMRGLIDLVPSGHPEKPPSTAGSAVVRGVHLASDSLILTWNGGLWDWLDPLTALRGLSLLRAEDTRWCLAFSSTARPGERPAMSMPSQARRLAEDLELGSDAVYFHPGAMPYADRSALLSESDIGLSLHPETLESHFAYRVRVLDYLWAGIPVLCSVGDAWAERVTTHDLGAAIPAGDYREFAKGARHIIDRGGRRSYEPALAEVAAQSTWDAALPGLERALHAAAAGGPRRRGLGTRSIAARHRAAATLQSGLGLRAEPRTSPGKRAHGASPDA